MAKILQSANVINRQKSNHLAFSWVSEDSSDGATQNNNKEKETWTKAEERKTKSLHTQHTYEVNLIKDNFKITKV